jgi:muramoyltetrapeptide carboxypeptidase LdcA involved in peptidoglycan recycling
MMSADNHRGEVGRQAPPILRPKALREGDVVAIAALSGGLDEEEAPLLERGVAAIEQMGFAVRLSPLVDLDRRWWWAAAHPREVAEELNGLLRDPHVRAVVALTGGKWTFGYLDLVDLEAVRADPKPLIGFSDISGLLLAVHSRTGLVTLHADLATHGFGYWHEADDIRRKELEDIYVRVLTSDSPAGVLPSSEPWDVWRPGRAQGPLIGGMLNRLTRIQATSFALEPERFDGAILFWEEAFTSTPGIWTDLQVLRHAGVLERIAGMVVGRPFEVDPAEGPETLRDLVLDVLGDRDIPVLGNADVGHDPPNVPLPLGVRAELDADARTLSLLEPAVEAG